MKESKDLTNPMDLSERRILITGASSGIGRSTAILLSRLGAQIVLTGRNEERLKETERLLQGTGNIVIPLELRDFNSYAELFSVICDTGNKLSGLVHCAGVANVVPIKVASPEKIQEMFEINFVSFMELVRHYIKKQNSVGGSIVNISAVNAHYPQKCMSVYAATKGALEAATASLALELFDKNIRINTVVPGPIDTPMARSYGLMSGGESNIIGQQLMPMGEPDDVANMIAFLLSNASKFITGRNFYVDGGRL